MDDAEVAAFLMQERTVTCATVGPRGWPHLMPLWYVPRETPAGEPGPRIWAWTYGSSQKVRNLERDPRATLQVEAAEEYQELRGVMLECEVVVHRELELVAELGAEILLRNSVPRGVQPPVELPTGGARRGHRAGRQARRARVRRAAPRELGSPQARRALLILAAPVGSPGNGATQGTDPLRGQGHAAAPDHAHERQAARAGRQQAGAVLRDRGDGAGGDRAGRDHHRAGDRPGDPRSRRRRLAVRRADHLHRAGRAGWAWRTRC